MTRDVLSRELRLMGWALHKDPAKRLSALEPHLNGGLSFQTAALRRIYTTAKELGDRASDEAIIEQLGPAVFESIGGTDRFREVVFNSDLMQEPQARHLADMVLEDYRKREQATILQRAAQRLTEPDGAPFTEIDAQLQADLDEFRQYQPSADRLTRNSRSMAELIEARPEMPDPVLADGALRRGDLFFLFGKSGLGKSQIAMRLAWAWTTGEQFLGMNTHGPLRVGLVTPELDSRTNIERYRNIPRLTEEEALQTDAIHRLFLLDRTTLPGPIDLRREQDRRELIRWIDDHRLDVCIIDAITDAYNGQLWGDDWTDLWTSFFTNLHKRTATGCTPVVCHHQSDKIADTPEGGSAFSGESAPMRKASLSFWLHRKRGGLVLENSEREKHRHSRPLGEFWLEFDEIGVPRPSSAPLDVSEKKADKLGQLADWIREQGGTATTEGIMKQTGVRNDKTARTYARDLGGVSSGGRNAVWTFPDLTEKAEGGNS